ncbi:hypothetical protein [Halobacillus litoralis]|uniref:hypothetical protein n=1 Tax=Halobacillus litoralis TaxID=45668 RepID=UPI0013E8C780|nr:hypothetical protein [Halobacillus litoralis]
MKKYLKNFQKHINNKFLFAAKNIQEAARFLAEKYNTTKSKYYHQIERGHKNARRFWLVPANPNDYDIESAFSYYETIDWKRSYNYENGDIVTLVLSSCV